VTEHSSLFAWGPQVDDAARIIVAQVGVDTVEAVLLLVDYAKSSGRTVNDTARLVVERRLRFDGVTAAEGRST
jgi:hypothetical protein